MMVGMFIVLVLSWYGIDSYTSILFAFITMLLTSGALFWFLKSSDFGRTIRATAQGPAAFSQACICQRLGPGSAQSVARTGKQDEMIARLHSHVSALSDFCPRRFSSGIVMFGKHIELLSI